MKVKLLKDCPDKGSKFTKGKVIDVTTEEAGRLIDKKFAVATAEQSENEAWQKEEMAKENGDPAKK